MKPAIKEEILDHLNGLNKLESEQGHDAVIDKIADRYDVSRNVVMQVIAEWSAGRGKVENTSAAEDQS